MRPLFTKRTARAERPTPECEAAVDEVLATGNDLEGEADQRASGNLLKVVRTDDRESPPVGEEIKAMLADMNRRSRVMRNRLEEDDTPDAA